ncbi:MAG: tetratricopeptide repeat protein [Proteobacteria bacterium]|nr:tetratricopeptide repeat protein [Pseudomonadota bacterium]HQR03886.1 tetratricopeptide repeat protein [Rhodocyclaceae bacterium]
MSAKSRTLAAFAAMLLAVLSPGSRAGDEVKDAPRYPVEALTPQILYQFLLAEIAASRGNLGVAAGVYVDLAKKTRDPRIAQRAAEIAYHSHQFPLALEAARLWFELEPDAEPARQLLWSLLSTTGRTAELSDVLAKALAVAGDKLGPDLLGLNRLLAGQKDKQAVRALVDQVTTPYLARAEAHFARAQAALAVDDKVAARTEAEQAVKLDPDLEPAVLLQAQLLLPDANQAAALLGDFATRHPKARNVALAHARVLVDAKRYADARQAFGALLDQDKDNPELLYAVGLLDLQLNDTAGAEQHLQRLLDLGYQSEADSAHLYLGQIAEDAKRMDEALAHYNAVDPASRQALPAALHAANLLRQQGKLEAALERLQQMQVTTPQDRTTLQLAQAQLLSEAGREEDAYTLLDNALRADRDNTDLIYETALAAERVGKHDVSEPLLQQLIQRKPDDPQAYNALGYSYADRGVNLAEAQRLVAKALAVAPDDPFYLDSMGWVVYRQGNTAAAEQYLRRALSLRSDPEIAAHLGEVLWYLGRRDEARQIWDAAAKAAPGNAALTATLKRFQP